MNKKFIIILLMTIIGIFYFYNKDKKLSIWSLISNETAIIYEINDPYKVWNEFKNINKSDIKNKEIFQLINDEFDAINLFLENKLLNFSIENKLLIGINTISKNKIDPIFFIKKNKINKENFFSKISSLKYSVNERIYNRNTIYEIKNGTKKYNFLFVGNFLIFSSNSMLIEDVIRTSKNKKLSFKHNNEDLFNQIKLEKDYGNIYLNFNKLGNVIISIIDQKKSLIPLNLAPKSSFLDVYYINNHFYLNGFTSNINKEFNSSFTISESMFKLIPTNTIFFYHVISNNNNELKIINKEYEKNLSSYHSKYEIGRIIIESNYSNSHEEIFIFKNKIIKDNPTDSIEYKNYYIKNLKEQSFKKSLEKIFLKDSSSIFYFNHQEFIIFSNKISVLRNYIDDIINKNLWDKETYYKNHLSKLNNNSNISLIINYKKVINNLIVSKKYEILKNIEFISLQMKGFKNKFYTNLTIQLKEKSTESLDKEKIQSNKIFTAQNKLIIKPNIIFSHLDNAVEIITQDENFNVYHLSKELKTIWKDSIEGKIISKIFQIDYYRNNKKQILFSTENKIHSYDRKGNKLIGFPILNPSKSKIDYINIIDYDNSKRIRIVIANENGEIYLLDKNGNKLSGWNPLNMDEELSEAPRHIRISDKDYIIVILKDGKIYLKNRKGENYKGFPIHLNSTISNKIHLIKGANSKNSFIEIINDKGNFYKINMNGKIISTNQMYRPSINSKFKMIQDPTRKYNKILSIDYNSIFIENNDKESMKLNFIDNKNFIYQYYNFNSKNEIFSILNNNEEKIYLYDYNLEPFIDFTINSTHPISIIYSSRKKEFKIFKIFNNTLSIIEIED
jgi:hypothetical protein